MEPPKIIRKNEAKRNFLIIEPLLIPLPVRPEIVKTPHHECAGKRSEQIRPSEYSVQLSSGGWKEGIGRPEEAY
jgi:hypothetical protein